MPKASVTNQYFFIRNMKAWDLLETFLVAAVTAVLVIRLFLSLTGYPQLHGRGLHIAHLLWGGLLMLAAIVILLSFLNDTANHLAAIVGGVGFGMFIDEIGKFVTSDNDYFFQPAVALIYVIFILTFLAMRTIHTRKAYTPTEYLLNALRELEHVVLHNLDEEEKHRALQFLARSDPRHPLVAPLTRLLARAASQPSPRPRLLTRLKHRLRAWYGGLVRLPGFSLALTLFFVTQLVLSCLEAVVLVFFLGLGWEHLLDVRVLGRVAERMQHLSFIDSAQLASSFFSGVFIVCGILRLRRWRLAAYRLFERAMLVSIFLTQVFHFYKAQFAALLGLGVNILILVALRYMIEQERASESGAPDDQVVPLLAER
jgi:hypothetical protein